MITYQEALQRMMSEIRILKTEKRSLIDAIGLILAAPVDASWDMPPWDNSAMDGYAIRHSSLQNEPLQVVGEAFAGHPYGKTLQAGEALQITTGAPLPAGADTVVPLEQVSRDGDLLTCQAAVKGGQHIRPQGEEYRAGEELLPAGTWLRAGEIGLLASAGIECVTVVPQPTVAIISTGDELVELGRTPGPGQIVNSNLPYLIARIKETGAIPLPLGVGKDQPEQLDALFDQALEVDLIITTGGVSVGSRDLVQDSLLRKGFQKKFWKVAIKPGKPVLFGLLQDKPCFGLPGNPAATAATFELFVRPALNRMSGVSRIDLDRRQAVLQNDLKGGGQRQAFLWARCRWQGEKGYQVEVPQRQGSGQIRSVQGANALLPMPADGSDLRVGQNVEIILLNIT
jgi:molybdopterin molybdotransferase